MSQLRLLLQLNYWPCYRLNFYVYALQTLTGTTVNITNIAQEITSFTPAQDVADQKVLWIATNIGVDSGNKGISKTESVYL